MDEHELVQLVEGARRGDAAAFGALAAEFRREVVEWVRRRLDPGLRAKADASDVAQSVMREALERAGRFEYRGRSSLRAWLLLLAEHKLSDLRKSFRSAKRNVSLERGIDAGAQDESGAPNEARSPAFGPATRAMARDAEHALRECVDRLPEPLRAVWLLDEEGKSSGEIALIVGVPESTIRTRRIEARRRLAAALRSRWAHESSDE